MIIYVSTKSGFIDDVSKNRIEDKILTLFKRQLRQSTGESEINSWKNSMQYMHNVLVHSKIPDDAGVAIEYNIPQTSKRIDFILTGQDGNRRDTAVIVELKQWQEVWRTEKDGIVTTVLNGRKVDTNHPSFQAWSYAALLEDFNEAVRTERIQLSPCAYLHNCSSPHEINHPFYAEHTGKAPSFLKADVEKLTEFIENFVKHGDRGKLIYRIDQGKIKPSKSLADALLNMIQGNKEFLLIDDQKLVYETALALADKAERHGKQVLLVEGGPGTGKSVVAINLLVEITKREKVVHYVTKNAAPRQVYQSKLAGTLSRTRIENMFQGSGKYVDKEKNCIDVLVVDEAHRLNEKSGMFQNLGENQIKEIIHAAKLSVFFIDEDQRVTWKDAGRKSDIRQWAKRAGAAITELALQSQFRCNGSNGYLAWLDHTLQIRETANRSLEGVDYDFRVFDDPIQLRQVIFEKNLESNKARIVAGYCWDWISRADKRKTDINFPEHGFKMRWNLTDDGGLWILKPDSVNEVGCIHTCQGLELDYIGVIIGPDFLVRDGRVVVSPASRAKTDQSLKGYKQMARVNPDAAFAKAAEIIKNTYRTLMTRGQKGCFIFCTDPETNAFFKQMASTAMKGCQMAEQVPYAGIPLTILDAADVRPYENAVPVYDLRIAAGIFSEEQQARDCDWVELPDPFTAKPGYFVARVVGHSMNRRIASGSWCLFRTPSAGSRNGKIVLVQHRNIQDQDLGQFAIKTYYSEKSFVGDEWRHERIILKPDTTASGYHDIILEKDEAVDLRILGEFVASLGQRPD
ncbi:MAG TPA: DUF2075 domain-containing protein [Kiritimatiellia bacterium]|nr:DUF2075 domain-containing protein [Kiritimatiellia bacterium]HMP34157.1 DUF2075 domain-containing protein [Kiritimatiellia bacterium]